MSKKASSLASGLKAITGSKPAAGVTPIRQAAAAPAEAGKSVLIGANFPPQVRAALRQVHAHPSNVGKTSKDLLGEAINDLCAKYGVPEPYTLGE